MVNISFPKTQNSGQNPAFKQNQAQLRTSLNRWLVEGKESGAILEFKDEVPEVIGSGVYDFHNGGERVLMSLIGASGAGKSFLGNLFKEYILIVSAGHYYGLEKPNELALMKRIGEIDKPPESALKILKGLLFDLKKHGNGLFSTPLIEGIGPAFDREIFDMFDLKTFIKTPEKERRKRFFQRERDGLMLDQKKVLWEDSVQANERHMKPKIKLSDIVFNGQASKEQLQNMVQNFAEAIKPTGKTYSKT